MRQIDSIINDMIKRVESLGVVGNVEESLKLLKKVDALKEEKSKIVVSVQFKCISIFCMR